MLRLAAIIPSNGSTRTFWHGWVLLVHQARSIEQKQYPPYLHHILIEDKEIIMVLDNPARACFISLSSQSPALRLNWDSTSGNFGTLFDRNHKTIIEISSTWHKHKSQPILVRMAFTKSQLVQPFGASNKTSSILHIKRSPIHFH